MPPYLNCTAASVTTDALAGGPGFVAASGRWGSLAEGGAFYAEANVTGPNSLPVLRASAEAQTITLPQTQIDNTNYFFNSTDANAQVIQRYDYLGTDPLDYQLHIQLDASVKGPLVSILANLSVFDVDGYDPGNEVNPILVFGSLESGGSTTTTPVHQEGILNFTLNPGQSIYVIADLTMSAPHREVESTSEVHAGHTFTADFASGDASLLEPTLTSANVPEPGTLSILALGVGGIGIARRNRIT